jgi:hypothetical protein
VRPPTQWRSTSRLPLRLGMRNAPPLHDESGRCRARTQLESVVRKKVGGGHAPEQMHSECCAGQPGAGTGYAQGEEKAGRGMSDDQCIHGMTPAWCATCRGRKSISGPPAAEFRPYDGRSTQNLLNDLCDLLDVARYVAVPGSSPSRVFDAAAVRAHVEAGSMPEVGAAIATKAGLSWGPECDNRGIRNGGTVVSREGVGMVVEALGILAKRTPERSLKLQPGQQGD